MRELKLAQTLVPHPKLDARLATLVGIGVGELAPGELESTEGPEDGDPGMRRSGSLSFLRRPWGSSEEMVRVPEMAQAPMRRELPPSVPVFIRTKSAAALARLATSGVPLVSRAKTIATAEIPLAMVMDLEKDEDVVAIEWTGAFRPLAGGASGNGARRTRAACAAIGLDPSRFGELDGRGCIVGVVDLEGIDFYHPSFVTPGGRTRILALWDQRARPSSEDGDDRVERGPGKLGAVYRRDAIFAEISPHQPVRHEVVPRCSVKGGHGTVTAGLAVGTGHDRPDARGAAPGADLVFVNTFGSGPGTLGAMTELADAIRFVMDEADAAGKPCVVNLSLGEDLGPRDGTSPIEQFIDELLEEDGRAVVIAAGNSHGRDCHVSADLGPGDTASFELVVSPRNTERAVVELWYDAGEGPETTLDVEIEAPGAEGRTPVIHADELPHVFDTGKEEDLDATRVLVLSTPRAPAPWGSSRKNGVVRVEITPRQPDGELLSGKWQIHVRSRGKGSVVHGWVDHRYIRWEGSSSTLTLTTPATARRAIVVGALDVETDEITWYSGRGQDRGGMKRPDLLAPGGPLVAAWAESTARYVDTASGTSIAAPIVAGVTALVLQQIGKDASPSRVRDEILAMCRDTKSGGEKKLWVEHAPASRAAQAASVEKAPPSPRNGRQGRPGAPVVRPRPRDAAQIIEGHYILLLEIQAEWIAAGEVLVESGTLPGVTIEHWALGASYVAPSEAAPESTLRLRYVGKPIPLRTFLARQPRGTQYVRTACQIVPIARARRLADKESFPSTLEGVNQTTRSTEMVKQNYMRPLDRTQIIEGKYELYQEGTLVGTLRVKDHSPGCSTEQWLLHSSYLWPSEGNPDQSIRFIYRGGAGTEAEFLQNVPAGTTFIVAQCAQQTLP